MCRRGNRLYDRSEKKFFELPENVPADFAIYFDGDDERPITKAEAEDLCNKKLARKEGHVIVRCPSQQIEYVGEQDPATRLNDYVEKFVERFEKRRVLLYLKAGITGQNYLTEITTRSSNLSSRMSPRAPHGNNLVSHRKINSSPYMRILDSRILNVGGEHKHEANQTFCAICILEKWKHSGEGEVIRNKEERVNG